MKRAQTSQNFNNPNTKQHDRDLIQSANVINENYNPIIKESGNLNGMFKNANNTSQGFF